MPNYVARLFYFKKITNNNNMVKKTQLSWRSFPTFTLVSFAEVLHYQLYTFWIAIEVPSELRQNVRRSCWDLVPPSLESHKCLVLLHETIHLEVPSERRQFVRRTCWGLAPPSLESHKCMVLLHETIHFEVPSELRPLGILIDSLIHWFVHRLIGSLTDWLNDWWWFIDWLIGWLVD